MKKHYTMNYRILTLALAVIGVTFGSLAQEAADTVKVIENANNIIVVAKDGKTVLNAEFPGKNSKETLKYQYEVNVANSDTISVKDEFSDNWGMDLPFVKDKSMNVRDNKVRRYIGFLSRGYWGWRFNYDGKGNVRNGWEYAVPDFVSVKWQRRGAEFEIGLGASSSYYFASDNFCFQKEGDKIVLAPVPDGMYTKQSSLMIDALLVPVFYNQRLGKNGSFTLGAIANFNFFSSATTKLHTANDQYVTTTYRGLQQRLLTLDTYASINFYGIGVFAKWSPIKVFDKKFGPELKGFTIGVEILTGSLFTF